MRSKYAIMLAPILLIVMLLSAGCKKELEPIESEPDELKPQVNFTIIPATEKDPFTFSFKGGAINYKDVIWSFGDGSNAFGVDVTHTFKSPGVFKIMMKAQNSLGYWAQQEAKITIKAEDILDFSVKPQPDGTIKLEPELVADVEEFSWYYGENVNGALIGSAPITTIPELKDVIFTYVTMKIKTKEGAAASISKIVTNKGSLIDITSNGIELTVSKEGNGGTTGAEGSLKLVDGLSSTKMFVNSGYTNAYWAQQEILTPTVVNGYIIISANDVQDRDPKDWDFLGSHDGVTWVKLDSRANYLSPLRFETRLFLFDNTVAYRYYRLNVKAVKGGTTMQMAEWRLMYTK
ncbi:PKD domain-containing protein [Pedobacter nyackensis]|uniref:PKD domain-containing protein n=1 Tax=Pedobacter nyackensis TaxID=475255 RepID=UPI00292D8A18|nr:PKD domain-containing protein [Pedobacter nyackensis]